MQSIILLHGALGAASSMSSLSKALEDTFDVHPLDFAGHGAAPWPAGRFSMDLFQQDVIRLMDERGLKTAHIFGYSMGGFVGLRLAAGHPDRISSVITLATKLSWTPEVCEREGGNLNADILESKAQKFVEMLGRLHTANGWRKVMGETQTMLKNMYQHRIEEEDLAGISVPVRLMVGDRDKMVTLHETDAAYRMLGNAELAVLPRTPHPLEQADTALLAIHIRDMIDRLTAG